MENVVIEVKSLQDGRSFFSKFFGVISDRKAWGALLYMFLSLATGIFYFTWAVTGISLSAGLFVLIIGLPFTILFILSIRGLAILEGRLVEALLGVQMPGRTPFHEKKTGLWARFKSLITDRYTWSSMLYMILQLGFGVVYFTVFTILMATSLGLIVQPFIELFFHRTVFIIGDNVLLYFNGWMLALALIMGIALFFSTLHFARWTGKLHGAWAKSVLVRI